jgi:hypothetical protein
MSGNGGSNPIIGELVCDMKDAVQFAGVEGNPTNGVPGMMYGGCQSGGDITIQKSIKCLGPGSCGQSIEKDRNGDGDFLDGGEQTTTFNSITIAGGATSFEVVCSQQRYYSVTEGHMRNPASDGLTKHTEICERYEELAEAALDAAPSSLLAYRTDFPRKQHNGAWLPRAASMRRRGVVSANRQPLYEVASPRFVRDECSSQAGVKAWWWYCPQLDTCARYAADCDSSGSQFRSVGSGKTHDPDMVAFENAEIFSRGFRRQVDSNMNGEIIPLMLQVSVAPDLGLGYQGLAMKSTGGLHTVAGTLDKTYPGFEMLVMPEAFRPSYNPSFLSAVLATDGQLRSALLNVQGLTGGTDLTSDEDFGITPKISLSRAMYVPREVAGATDLSLATGWQADGGTTPYYHALDMAGDNTLCVLAGTIKATWSSSDGNTKASFDLPASCTASYQSAGFWVVADVKVDGTQQWVTGTASEFQLQLQPGSSTLELYTTATLSAGQEVTLGLDGIVLASNSGSRVPAVCRDSASSCEVLQNKVDVTQDGFPTDSIIGTGSGSGSVSEVLVLSESSSSEIGNLLVMGSTLQKRTCALQGVAQFTSIGGEAVAQIDPNYRDPATKQPLCFPLATMVFFAGVVADSSSAITRSVALQIEPHGRLRVLGEENSDIKIRLDGIVFHPLTPYNQAPKSCAPYCFPAAQEGGEPGSSGCVKYCTPPQYETLWGEVSTANCLFVGRYLSQINCRCDLVKRIDCWKHEGSSELQCGQFKQLVQEHTQAYHAYQAPQCAQVCADQLSSF